MLISIEIRVFLDLIKVRYKCANVHHCRICVTEFKEKEPFLAPPIHEQPRKGPS